MRVCAIDVGTNTVNALVADVAGGGLTVVAETEGFARLGEGVDAAGRLAPAAMDRAVALIGAAGELAAAHGAERTVIGATSASRDAANVGELRARVRRETGLDYAVISGEDEARLCFAGALAMLPGVDEAVVVDVGGGSTEVVAGARGEAPSFATSLDVGTVRLTERHGAVPPVTPETERAVRATVGAALAGVPAEVFARGALVTTGSTASVAQALMGGDWLSRGALAALRRELAALTPAAIRARDPARLSGRADVMVSALLLLEGVLARAGAEGLRLSRGGLRHGLALRAAAPRSRA